MKISVNTDKIHLQHGYSVDEISIDQYFKITKNTFSSLFIEEENVSFRINIENICVDKHLPFDELLNLHPKISKGQHTDFYCNNCDNVLCSQKVYNKIMAYPSCLFSLNDFFCHQAPNWSELLKPGVNDLFYGFSFIVLHKATLKNNVKEKERHIYCRRCLALLGEIEQAVDAVRLWSDAVVIKNASTLSQQISSICGSRQTQLLLHRLVRECLVPLAEPLQKRKHFVKVVLETSFPNRQYKYLLIHIIENQLVVLRNGQACNHDSNSKRNLKLDLEPYHAFKLLFKYISGGSSTDEFIDKEYRNKLSRKPEWQKDADANMKISPYLFCNLLDELQNNMMLAPPSNRQFSDFMSSYVFY